MIDIVGEVYRPISQIEARQLNRGQICWGPVGYLSSKLETVELSSYNPQDEPRNRFSISVYEPDERSVFEHAPVHELKLQSNEALVISRTKRRPVIVMSQKNQPWPRAGSRLAERGLVCLTVYSFHPNDSQDFRRRIRAQEYPWWLYVPEHLGFQEGFVRLDRLQTIEEAHLQPMTRTLTDRCVVVCF